MISKWNGMHIDLSGSKASITPAPKAQPKEITESDTNIEIGDFYLITTKNGQEYDGQITGLTETTLTIEHWNETKDRDVETDISFKDILGMVGFNDSQM